MRRSPAPPSPAPVTTPISMQNSAAIASTTITTKIDCTTAGGVLAHSTARCLRGKPPGSRSPRSGRRRSAPCDTDPEVDQADVVLDPRQEQHRRDVQRHRRHQHAADDARDHRDEGQDGQARSAAHTPRGSTSSSTGSRPSTRIASISSLARIEPICAVKEPRRAAGDDDRGEQHAELAQEGVGHQVDREDAGAEVLQHRGAEGRRPPRRPGRSAGDDRHRVGGQCARRLATSAVMRQRRGCTLARSAVPGSGR